MIELIAVCVVLLVIEIWEINAKLNKLNEIIRYLNEKEAKK